MIDEKDEWNWRQYRDQKMTRLNDVGFCGTRTTGGTEMKRDSTSGVDTGSCTSRNIFETRCLFAPSSRLFLHTTTRSLHTPTHLVALMKLVSSMTMKAVVQNGYGDPVKVLSVKDQIPVPVPNAAQVLVKVVATSVNTPDWATVVGKPYLLRLGVGLFRPRKNRMLGSDVAGIVEQVGDKVSEFKVGDHVFGSTESTSSASFAQYCVADPVLLAKKPASLPFDEAAACVMSGVTAYRTVDAANIKPGNTNMLINGASGGVGSFAIQMAKEKGATVTAVCSGKNAALCSELGADRVIDYTKTDFTIPQESTDHQYDVVLDNVLNHTYKELRRILKKPEGFVIPNSIGTERGDWLGAIPMFFFKPSNFPAVEGNITRDALISVAKAVESGRVKAVIDRVYSLDQAPQAIAYMASHRARGQVVIHISSTE